MISPPPPIEQNRQEQRRTRKPANKAPEGPDSVPLRASESEIEPQALLNQILSLCSLLPSTYQKQLLSALAEREGRANSMPIDPSNASGIEPDMVRRAFRSAHGVRDRKSRRKPVRVQRIWDAFEGRETEVITLDELARAFASTKDPKNSAQTAISRVNSTLKDLGIALEIKHVTAYRLERSE